MCHEHEMQLYWYNRARTHLWQGSSSRPSCNHNCIPSWLLLVELPQAVHLGTLQVRRASLMLSALTGTPQRSACMALDSLLRRQQLEQKAPIQTFSQQDLGVQDSDPNRHAALQRTGCLHGLNQMLSSLLFKIGASLQVALRLQDHRVLDEQAAMDCLWVLTCTGRYCEGLAARRLPSTLV